MAAAAYYNEIDPYAADWLRHLIAAGHIAPGDVDERSIEDVHPDDLRPYTQCHFFAGIGVWSYALRRAGWPDDRPVWTGSCPCQPFSAAGKGTAFDDERHLWPAWHWLISQRRPPVVFGEQVASKDAEPWLDLVSADLEALGFAAAAVAFPSASVGAPHKRDRTYFVAHAQQHDRGRQTSSADHDRPQANRSADRPGGCGGSSGSLGNAHGERAGRDGRSVRGQVDSQDGQLGAHDADAPGRAGGMGNSTDQPCQRDPGGISRAQAPEHGTRICANGIQPVRPEHAGAGMAAGPGPVNGFWGAADWLLCRDGRWRPVEPGTQPLVNGAPARVGRLRAYGNAINAVQAQIFIEECMRCI